ncbi:MAG: hypothetical protein H6581_25115 [Bacteroidia bacterium]|nr:hypothetical protein [Bacteroidia bacterium]
MVDFRELRRKKLQEQKENPFAAAQKFLNQYWGDEGHSEMVKKAMEEVAKETTWTLKAGMEALNTVAQSPQFSDQQVMDLVIWYANYPLENPSGEAARSWLVEAAAMIKKVIETYDQNP